MILGFIGVEGITGQDEDSIFNGKGSATYRTFVASEARIRKTQDDGLSA